MKWFFFTLKFLNMKKLLLALMATSTINSAIGQVNADYFLPKNETYHKDIPTPEEIIGHPVGKWHANHDKLGIYANVSRNFKSYSN